MKSKSVFFSLTALAAAVAAALVLRHSLSAAPAPEAGEAPSVAVAAVGRQDLFQELTLQAEFRPYLEVELYAKVSGYLRSIGVDFGDQVKAGDLIATIEVPELQDQLDRAEADYRSAHLDFVRLQEVDRSQPNLVAQQDLDAAQAKDGSAAADMARYRTLLGYTRITAPFDGVITARYADPGALIQASTQSQARPLVRLSENQRLRLDFPVSVSYAGDIAVGDPVEIRLAGSGQRFEAKIARSTRRISMDTRTMETEVEVPNKDLKLIPGMYATVTLRLHPHLGALALPVQAVGAADASSVYVVGADGRIAERPVRLGFESPDAYEVLSGLKEGDLVVIGSRAGLRPGEPVAPRLVASSAL